MKLKILSWNVNGIRAIYKKGFYDWFVKGKRFLREGNYSKAIFYLEQVKLEIPEKASIRECLGRAYYNSGQAEKARNEFQAALEIDPTNSYAYYGAGLSLVKMGDLALALRYLKLCCALSPAEKRYQRSLVRVKKMIEKVR